MLNEPTKAERAELLRQQGFCVSISNKRSCKMHGHEFLEFSYIESGRIAHTFGGEVEELRQGDYFIVDYGTAHRYQAIGDVPLKVINLLFFPGFVDRTLGERDSFEKVVNSYLIRFRYRSLNHSPAGIAFHDGDGSIYGILRRIIEEYTRAEVGYLEYIRCLIVEMLILIMRGIGGKDENARTSPVIADITAHIKKHYTQRLRLSDFATAYNYSLSHLSKKFTEETGSSFIEYLQHIRIEQSCKLLESDTRSVGAIAEAVGYSDLKFFNKVFKETLGVTPREFRKMSKVSTKLVPKK